jgi:predicted RNA-binding protein with PUA-like domain
MGLGGQRGIASVSALPVLLTPAQVAAQFHRTERTVRNWVARGLLHPVRVGRSVFFRADDARALIEGQSEAAHDTVPDQRDDVRY